MKTRADMSRDEWVAYLNFHGPILEAERELLARALERYGANLKACEAHEKPGFKVSAFVADMLAAADACLPEEVREHLETTTAPRLQMPDLETA